METKRLALGGGFVVVAAGIGGFLYVSRPLPEPTKPVDTVTVATEPILIEGRPDLAPSGVVYTIDPTQSSAKYEIDELLNGKPKHVVGETGMVEGIVTINNEDPSLSKIGIITVNARTFKSDSEKRDNTVGRMILKSAEDAHEYIVFEPTNLTLMPKQITKDQEFTFKVTGKLTITGVTKEVTFDGKATQTNTAVKGLVTTTFTYGDFGLVVPDLPFLANVNKTAVLSLNFVAKAQ